MSRFRKKATFMNMFGRAEDDRSLLHSSSKLDGSIGDMSGTYRKDTELDQPTSESPEEFSLNFISTAGSTDTPSTQTASPRKAQSNIINEVDGGDDQQQYLESPKAVSPEREHRVDREKSVSPRRGIREKLRSTLTATGDHPVSPTKGSMRKSLSERIMGTVKSSSSPKGSKVNHIGEIKVNFATIAEHNPTQPLEIKAESDSPPKHNKKLLKSFSKITRKSKENARIDAVADDSLKTKITATVQTVHSSDLQHSFHQLNLGEMVPEVVCEAVKSKELMDDLKKQNKDLYMMDDSSSEDESSTDVSDDSLDMLGNEAGEERGNEAHDIPRSKSAENSNDDFFAHIDVKVVEVETSTHFPGGCSADTKTIERTGLSEKEKSPSGEHTAKSRKLKTNEHVDVGRKPRRSKNNDVQTEHEVRTWVRSSSQPRRRSTKETAAMPTVELAFSPPSSPKIETHSRLGVAENDVPSNHQTSKTRRSPQSNKISPRQRTLGDAFANRKPSDEINLSSMPGELNDPASDTHFAEMKAVLDDFERMAISDFLKHPNDHLKDVDLNMSTIPFESCYIDVKDLDFSENTNMDEITGVGDRKLMDPLPDQADVAHRYRRLREELEQSKFRLALSSQDVSRVEQVVEQLKQRLDDLKRSEHHFR